MLAASVLMIVMAIIAASGLIVLGLAQFKPTPRAVKRESSGSR
jgi:hypothetical protein